jgi:hypothetical protein
MSTASGWELLGFRQLAVTDETAGEFRGVMLIHRIGSAEPVEEVEVLIKRSVLQEIRDTLGRLLARSTPFTPPQR